MNKSKYYQRGAIGLAGAIIAMVVAAIGLIALMQLQGNMTSGIANSKARTEAWEIAQKRGEYLRAHITQAQFESDLATSPSEKIWASIPADETTDNAVDGVNAKFYEECIVRDVVGSNYKEVMVRVSWYDETQDPTATPVEFQSVSLNNFIIFQNPDIIAGIWSEQNQSSPEELGNTRMNVGIERVQAGTENDDRPSTVPPIPDTGTTEIRKRVNSLGNHEIYLGTGDNANVVLTSFGGIIHQLRGKIHFEETHILEKTNFTDKDGGLYDIRTIATSPAYCEYMIVDLVAGVYPDNFVEYVCFVPGDCSETDFSSAPDDCKKDENGDISEADYPGHQKDIKALELNGGWYGKVGLFGVPVSQFDDAITGDSCEDPARLYVSHRLCHTIGVELCTDTSLITAHNQSCEYQNDCTFQQSGDVDISDYTGYISHCEPLPADYEIIDGFCIEGTPYAIYENEGINGSYAYNHFWLIDGDLNDKSCTENLTRFSQSSIAAAPEVRIDPQYLVDHNLVRPLGINVDPPFTDITPWPADDNGEPANVITEPIPNAMGLMDRIPPPFP